MGRLRDWWASLDAADDAMPAMSQPGDGITRQLSAAVEARSSTTVATRAAAVQLSVVARSRDLICGVLSQLPLTRIQAGVNIGPGWLERPDPEHDGGWFIAQLADDLMFHGYAFARITVRGRDDRPLALEWMRFVDVVVHPDGSGVTWYRRGVDQAGLYLTSTVEALELGWVDVVAFESPLLAVLATTGPLETAARLDETAQRFVSSVAAGWVQQRAGDDLSDVEAMALTNAITQARLASTTAYFSADVEYHESLMDPSRLQLVEARSYQDAAVARVCNVPNFALGVGVPHDSMTYKTAATARMDLIDFGISPYIGCIERTLSGNQVTPRGTVVQFDLEPFLRTQALASLGPGAGVETPADATTTPDVVPAGG